ncbi:MAG: APC family permease [Dehalococcoidia bacterium]
MHTPAGVQRRLGLWGTTLSGVGIILGAGIYVLIGAATELAGATVWASFIIGAVLAAATGLSYAELASMFPHAGGTATFAREAFGARAGFVIGWLLEVMAVLAAAAVAIGFGNYAQSMTGVAPAVSAAALLLVMGGVAWLGVRETVAVTVVLTLIEAMGLVVVVVVGLPHLGTHSLTETATGIGGVLAGASLVFFAYTGFEQIVTLADETRDPTRTIPRALLLAIGLATALYIGVSIVAVSVVPWRELATSQAPLADVMRVAAGSRPADAIALIALFATANTVLLLLATGARLAWGMARQGLLPALFGQVDRRRETPTVAVVTVTTTAILFAVSIDIGRVAQLANFTLFVAFLAVNAAVLRLRLTAPDTHRPFRIGVAVRRLPLSSVFGLAVAAVLLARLDPSVLLGGAAVTLLGLALSGAAVRPARGEVQEIHR